MFDTTRSYFNDMKERPVAAGATLSAEGQCLVYVSDGAGGLAVQPSAGAASERVAGFLISDALRVATEVVVETFTIPAAAPYTVQLKNSNISAGSERVFNNTTSTVITEVCPVPAATQYCLVDLTGGLTFNAAQAGNSVTIQYRFNLTLEQILNKYHERSINNRAQDYFSSASVGCLEGEIFTSAYDTTVVYAAGATVYSGAGGNLTSTAGGTAVGYVSQVPGVNDALLGCKYQIPTV